MMRSGFLWLLSLLILPHPASRASSLVQDDELRKLRDELVKARLENLALKLRLARLGPKPQDELKILVDALEGELPEVVNAAFRELAALPEDRRMTAVPAVLRRFHGSPDWFRIDAVHFLGRVTVPDAQTTVLSSASDPVPAVRKAVAGALKTASEPAAAQTLMVLFHDRDPEVRVAALDALGVAKRERAVAPLAAALSLEKDPQIIEKMVDALGSIGSAEATDALIQLLSATPREAIRWSCINSLGKIGDPRAGPRLLPYMDPPQPLDVRQVTIESMGKLKETSALPRLAVVLKSDPEEKLRHAAALAFGLMAGAGTIESVLLPAYLEEASDSVRRAIWSSMLTLAGEGFVPNERLAQALLEAGRKSDADQICTRLHASKLEGDLRGRRLVLEESVARALFEAGDFKAALSHYRQVSALSPDRMDAVRRAATCQRELQELDGCIRTLMDLKDPEPLAEEAWIQLQSDPGADRRKSLEAALRTATQRLVDALGSTEESVRKASLESVRRLGRKILPVLAAELEEGPRSPPLVLEAGSAITGIPNDPSQPNGLKSKAAAWRAWLEQGRIK